MIPGGLVPRADHHNLAIRCRKRADMSGTWLTSVNLQETCAEATHPSVDADHIVKSVLSFQYVVGPSGKKGVYGTLLTFYEA